MRDVKATLITWLAFIALPSVVLATETITEKHLVDTPKRFIGKEIRIARMGCVDDPKGGFLCLSKVDGQLLRIEASALGVTTSQKIAERMISSCKGTANLASMECEFSIAISPTSAMKTMMDTDSGSIPTTLIYSRLIDLFKDFPTRPRR